LNRFRFGRRRQEKETPATTTAKIWQATAFNEDQDGRMTAKFKRLMGIKGESGERAILLHFFF